MIIVKCLIPIVCFLGVHWAEPLPDKIEPALRDIENDPIDSWTTKTEFDDVVIIEGTDDDDSDDDDDDNEDEVNSMDSERFGIRRDDDDDDDEDDDDDDEIKVSLFPLLGNIPQSAVLLIPGVNQPQSGAFSVKPSFPNGWTPSTNTSSRSQCKSSTKKNVQIYNGFFNFPDKYNKNHPVAQYCQHNQFPYTKENSCKYICRYDPRFRNVIQDKNGNIRKFKKCKTRKARNSKYDKDNDDNNNDAVWNNCNGKCTCQYPEVELLGKCIHYSLCPDRYCPKDRKLRFRSPCVVNCDYYRTHHERGNDLHRIVEKFERECKHDQHIPFCDCNRYNYLINERGTCVHESRCRQKYRS